MQSYGGAQLAAPTWLTFAITTAPTPSPRGTSGGLRVSTTSSAAGATARIAVIVQTGVGFLSDSYCDSDDKTQPDVGMQQQMSAKTAMGEQL